MTPGARRTEPTQKWPVRPRIPGNLTSAEFPRDDLVDDAMLSELAFVDVDLSGRSARLVDIDQCQLTGARLSGSRLERLIVTDSVLERCDLATVELSHGAMTRVELSACRLTGFATPGAVWRHVLVKDCAADLSSFSSASFTHVKFVDCRFHGSDFVGADLKGTQFRRCELTRVDLSDAKTGGAAFVDCTWDGVRGISSLAGAMIVNHSPIDGLAFTAAMAQALNITLADPDDFPDE